MRIGVDADAVGRDGSGNETYIRGMIGGLQSVLSNGNSLVLAGPNERAMRELADDRTEVEVTETGLLGELLLGHRLNRAGADVALCQYNAPVRFKGKVATVVHDIAYMRVPDAYPRVLRMRIGISVRRSVATSDLVVTVSEFSREELLTAFPKLDPKRVCVTYNAPDAVYFDRPDAAQDAEVLAKFALPERFVLGVGNLQPRKNIPRLIDACRASGVSLVLVGQPMWDSAAIVAATRAAGVQWLGYVTRTELAALYRRATLFAYPSVYEGFGLPIIEAMASGTATVCAKGTVAEEVAAGAGQFVDPLSVEDIAAGVERLMNDDARRAELGAAGALRARTFTWDASAAALTSHLARLDG